MIQTFFLSCTTHLQTLFLNFKFQIKSKFKQESCAWSTSPPNHWCPSQPCTCSRWHAHRVGMLVRDGGGHGVQWQIRVGGGMLVGEGARKGSMAPPCARSNKHGVAAVMGEVDGRPARGQLGRRWILTETWRGTGRDIHSGRLGSPTFFSVLPNELWIPKDGYRRDKGR